jgi:hypothetical protein
MPVGDATQLEPLQFQTICLTVTGMFVLLFEIFRKSNEEVKQFSKF